MSKSYVILGAGIAGISAAEAIRSKDPDGTITVLSKDPHYPYYRPQLTKSLNKADLSADQILVHPENWYSERRIDLKSNTDIRAISPSAHNVTLGDGTEVHYDKCIYALGSTCFVPPIPGHDLKHVKTIRTIEDVKAIQDIMQDHETAVLIGGGVLGLEAAWGLLQCHKRVTVLEAAPRLMPRQLDEEASALVSRLSEAKGLELHTGVKITEIKETDTGMTVMTETGSYDADLVLVSAGVRANVQLAKDAGVTVERAIVINAKAETNIEDLYACGDCAQYQGINYALWSQAIAEGTTAGINAAGGNEEYHGIDGALTFFGLGMTLFAAGDQGSDPNVHYDTIESGNSDQNTYRIGYVKEGALCGVILINDLAHMKELNNAVQQHASAESVQTLI
ncbi:MAG: FAD-dependent oxidoreductase [Solobacterium sp.]|jgi:NAD(P)H-nitrite reductase large subunit|nr:FAD-dependent oxidoreductase [Solobacterium sp.]MCH4222344.1 FAD-dependent oxidoreductase [Solobacterium sp.]MCH4265515.1 FAD-dependent oxidoreductase [Solobacterium sp.]